MSAEKDIRHIRERKGLLVPLFEEFMRYETVTDDDLDDVEFHAWLSGMYVARESDRLTKPKVFSPSSLASCLRKVYLIRHHESLGIRMVRNLGIDAHYYFMKGNYVHKMWQFALFKLAKWVDDPDVFSVYGYEIPVMSKHRDHAGTIDSIVLIDRQPLILDFKGLNVRSAIRIQGGEIPHDYLIQIVDYLVLWNAQRKKPFRIEKALLMVESKGGPTPKHPLALHETLINLHEHSAEVQRRLDVLRQHEAANEIPTPECVSTTSMQFASCPFKRYCRDEVRAIQKEQKAEGNGNLVVATPERVQSVLKKRRRRT